MSDLERVVIHVRRGGSLPRFTFTDQLRLLAEYENAAVNGTARDLARAMKRTPQFLSRQARKLGLTRYDRPRPFSSETSSRNSKAWLSKNPHPRGFLGGRHNDAAKARISAASIANWDTLSPEERSDQSLRMLKTRVERYGTAAPPRTGTTWKSEWRTIGGRRSYYRSMWEANYARYLEWLRTQGEIAAWDHEPTTFWFEKIRRGTRSYLPDFRVVENNGDIVFHEVKGWMDDRSKTKLSRMRIYYPKVKIIVIDAKSYRSIARQAAMFVPEWETMENRDTLKVSSQGTLFPDAPVKRPGRPGLTWKMPL